MLDIDYSEQLERITSSINWSIQLPDRLKDFFAVSGDSGTVYSDDRKQVRIRARTPCIGYFEKSIPAVSRSNKPRPIYTSDFSRGGCGFIAPEQIYPTEHLRLILPKFWIQVEVVRCRKLGPNCFEAGAILLVKNPPDPRAFELASSI